MLGFSKFFGFGVYAYGGLWALHLTTADFARVD